MDTRLLKSETGRDIRDAVADAVRYWPNAHLGDCTAREDIRSAFLRIRRDVGRGENIQAAAGAVSRDALRHSDM
jgi:hypothetical protein